MAMQEEELRRRRGPGGAGAEGIGGAAALPGMLLPHMQGIPAYRGGGSGGLAAFLQQLAGGAPSPAGRNFQGAGGFVPPGFDNRNPIGGPNLAPGNLDTGQALQQPGLGHAVGQTGVMPPQSQSWRNYAPGYAMAAQLGFGAQPSGDMGRGVPSTGVGEAPGPAGGNRGPQGPEGPGRGFVQPAARQGPGGGGQGPAGGGNQGPAGVTGKVRKQAGRQSTARGGTGQENMGISNTPGGTVQAQRKNAKNNAYSNAQAGNASGSFGDTIHVVPNAGNNNTPSELGYNTTPTTGKKKGSGSKKASTSQAGKARGI